MPRKAQRVQVQLDLQAVTCPGVWLCPNGKVSLQIYMLDSCVQTTALSPVFPLLFHEQFLFYKTFYLAHTLVDLQRYIDKDFLYAELVQWKNNDVGNVIASFQTSLHEVLYPSSSDGVLSGVDIDLLMEPSKNFPGIIAPKIEISTRTTVEEIVCNNDQKDCYVINPKTISSAYISKDMRRQSSQSRQQRVCHSQEYYRNRGCVHTRKQGDMKPPFVYRKAEDTLLTRKPQGLEDDLSDKRKSRSTKVKKMEVPSYTVKRSSSKLLKSYLYEIDKSSSRNIKQGFVRFLDFFFWALISFFAEACCYCCESSHSGESCRLCTKYSNYFDSDRPAVNVNSDRVKSKDACVYKVSKSHPLREAPSKKFFKNSIHSNKTHPSSPDDYEIYLSSKESPCNNRMCVHCSPPQKPTLAKQIHHRLKKSLRCKENFDEDHQHFHLQRHQASSGSASACCSPRFRNCEQGFYKNLGKFYKELSRC